MRNIIIRLALFGLLPVAMAAGPNVNPLNQIQWPKVSGTSTPTPTCTSAIYGMPWTNTTNGNFYVCASTGWVLVAGGGGGGIGGTGTTGFIPKFTGTATIGNSVPDFGVTTAGPCHYPSPLLTSVMALG